MKGPKTRKKVDKLYVFGAGASHGSSGTTAKNSCSPLDSQFCKTIEDLKYERPQWVSLSKDTVLREFKDKDVHPFRKCGLESAILKQLGHLEFLRHIQPRRMNNTITQGEYLNHLAHLICFILRKSKPNRLNPYQIIFEKSFKDKDPEEIDDRIITFNYDDLLDRHFIDEFEIERTYFDKLKRRKDQSDRRTEIKFEFPFILKLHGSINWLCDTEEFERILNPDSYSKKDSPKAYHIRSIWYTKNKVPNPEDAESPLVIPPLPVKPITSIEIFEWLWTRAYEYLFEAKELVLCGYSLPDTDRMAVSLFSNFQNNSLSKITVVDLEPAILKKWKELLRRKGINKKVQWSYCETFEEYAQQL